MSEEINEHEEELTNQNERTDLAQQETITKVTGMYKELSLIHI